MLPNGLFMIPGKQAMWPASANVYLVRDARGLLMIDTGCGGPGALGRLLGGMERLNLALEEVHTILLTHAHPDHMGALAAILEHVSPEVIIHVVDAPLARDPSLLSGTFDIPLIAERFAAPGGDGSPAGMEHLDLLDYFAGVGCGMAAGVPTRTVRDGEVLQAGDFRFEVLHTPGHAPGHISLYEKDRGLLFAGDLVGAVTAWYSPSSGGVTGYLDSLEKMGQRAATLLLPSHGEPIADAAGAIAATRARLLERERLILAALASGPKTFPELLNLLFGEKAAHFFPGIFPGVAILESHLLKLQQEGRITRAGDNIRLLRGIP